MRRRSSVRSAISIVGIIGSKMFTRPSRNRPVAWVTAVIVAGALLCAGSALAHVHLDAPNGGETLEAGSTYTIQWRDVVDHGPADYDLWYSTSGPDGPWTTIVFDLEPSPDLEIYSYEWTVPDAPSSQVRLRVQQDNSAASPYLDISDSDLAIVLPASTETVTLEPTQDATLYEGDGGLANGAGSYLFTGRTETQNGGLERRALLAFDIASAIPEGSTITGVRLDLNMSRTTSGPQTVELRRVLESWAEGPSDPDGQEGGGATAQAGDTTWIHRERPQSLWSTQGGTFSAAASGSVSVDGTGPVTYASTPDMVADVQGWLDDPSSSVGWALVVLSPTVGSAKRFDSREHATPGNHPRLTVAYEADVTPPVASFGFSPSSPRAGEVLQLTDASTGPPTAWMWDFGDGSTSTEQSPFHTYATASTFTISLTVVNDAGSDTTTRAVTVRPAQDPELTELVMLPAAANAEGDQGSFFVTTLDVHNAGATTASYRLVWLPRNTDNASPTSSAIFTLPPGATQRFDNVVAGVFGLVDAVGALAVTSDSADLLIMSRTFNATDQGTFGQGIPGIPASELIAAGTRVRLLFLSQDETTRSNIGLVNGTASPMIIQWELFNATGASLRTGQTTLQAWGNTQLNGVLEDFAPVEAAYADVWTPTTGGLFTCYGSVLDQLSSDPTTVLPR